MPARRHLRLVTPPEPECRLPAGWRNRRPDEPCPHSACRHHLPRSCVLWEVEVNGEMTCDEVAERMGDISRAGVSHVERTLLQRREIKRLLREWRDHKTGRHHSGLAAVMSTESDTSRKEKPVETQWAGWTPRWSLDGDRIYAIYVGERGLETPKHDPELEWTAPEPPPKSETQLSLEAVMDAAKEAASE